MAGRFALLPHVRTRIAADAIPGADQRLVLAYDLEITGDGTPSSPRIQATADRRGPGDVVSIDRAQIARIEPEPGLRGFESNYFPFVEFVDPDFPWRYSLDAGPGGRWFVLSGRSRRLDGVRAGRASGPGDARLRRRHRP